MVLRYAKAGTAEFIEVTPEMIDKGTHLYYKADVVNLNSDTDYTYYIGKSNSDEWYGPFEFKTMAENVQSFSFVGVSDTQGSQEASYEYFKRDIKAAVKDCQDTAFIVNLGDLVDLGYDEQQWKWHFKALQGYVESIPYMGVVGNHDAVDSADNKIWGATENFSLHFNHPDNGAEAMAKISPDDMITNRYKSMAENLEDTFYSFDYGNAHFSVINTATEVSLSGEYGADYRRILQVQRDWLKTDLENTDKKWKIVLMHMGGYRADLRRKDIASVEYFGDIIDDNCVDLVLQGHDHIYMRSYPIVAGNISKQGYEKIDSTFLGTTYTVLGASATKRYEESSLEGPGEHVYIYENTPANQPVYCVFNVNDESIEVIAKQLDGTVLDKYSIVQSNLKNIGDAVVEAGSDRVMVKGLVGTMANVTILVTYPDAENMEKVEDIVYMDQLKTDDKGTYYFVFSDKKKEIGEYKIMMNIQGKMDEYSYMYQPKLYLVEDGYEINKLSDIKGDSLNAKMEIINTDNGRLYCAQFKDKILVNLSMVDIDTGISGGTTLSYLGSSNVDERKLFFWDRTSSAPLISPVIIK